MRDSMLVVGERNVFDSGSVAAKTTMNGFERSEALGKRTADIAIAVGITMTLLPLAVVAAFVFSAPWIALLPFAIRSVRDPGPLAASFSTRLHRPRSSG